MPSLILVLLTLKAVAFVAVASQGPSADEVNQFVVKLVQGYDENNDGKVDELEAANELMKNDQNKDNTLDASELDEYLVQINPNLYGISDQLWKLLNINRSGQVEKDDVINFFKSVDANADGKVDDGEIQRIVAKLTQHLQ